MLMLQDLVGFPFSVIYIKIIYQKDILKKKLVCLETCSP